MEPLEAGDEGIGLLIDLTDPPVVLADHAPAGVVVVDPSGYVVDWQIDDWALAAVATGAPSTPERAVASPG